ncbi:hypothetical protein SLEP1_g40667 [Rubroshorea leprosula]|uniref:Uncharacterized protein n=1 Tax=Rubroshorea leprosula TaxID=152421 RepID=A0AAV5L4I0_9ROSI|nr:hypothetical protein SLEP1_g40667 [Rubroshorea leprosula]
MIAVTYEKKEEILPLSRSNEQCRERRRATVVIAGEFAFSLCSSVGQIERGGGESGRDKNRQFLNEL